MTRAPMRRGVRLGIDVGSVRVGVARSDPEGSLAVPVATLRRPTAAQPRTDLAALADLVEEYEVLEVLVGLPLGLDGREGAAAASAREYARDLAAQLRRRSLGAPLRLVDERLSTAEATRGLQAAGRSARSRRDVVDQAAAVVIVQHALDTERTTGTAPGIPLDEERD